MNPFYETRDISLYTGGMSQYPYPLHVHEIVEMVMPRQGQVRMQIGQEHYDLMPGDMAIAFPFVPHSYENMSGDVSGFALFILPGELREFESVFSGFLPTCPVLRADKVPLEIHTAIEHLSRVHHLQPDPYRLAYAHLLLAYFLEGLTLLERPRQTENQLAIQIVQYVSEHALEPLSLRSTAEALNISPSYLSHLIADQLKTNLRQMINQARIIHAISLMRNPHMSITEISYDCGYESIRTFRRAFTAETGSLPGDFMAKMRSCPGNV